MRPDREQIEAISADAMLRLGDIVRHAAGVNVAQRVRSLGLNPEDLPEGKLDEALGNEQAHVLARIVEHLIRWLPKDEAKDEPEPEADD